MLYSQSRVRLQDKQPTQYPLAPNKEWSKSECPDVWIRLPQQECPKSRSNIEDQAVPLERNLYGHPLAGPLWKGQFEKVRLRMEKGPNWECLCVHREKGFFLSVYVDDIRMAGGKQNMSLMWKKLMKLVDLGSILSCT